MDRKLGPFKARMEEKRNAYRALVGKPLGKRPLGTRMDGTIILKWASINRVGRELGPSGLLSCE
jgi:hypothetical protein